MNRNLEACMSFSGSLCFSVSVCVPVCLCVSLCHCLCLCVARPVDSIIDAMLFLIVVHYDHEAMRLLHNKYLDHRNCNIIAASYQVLYNTAYGLCYLFYRPVCFIVSFNTRIDLFILSRTYSKCIREIRATFLLVSW